MFGLFKKKPIEVKYGHENYLSDYNAYEVNDRNWILSLSALFVEAKDLALQKHRARHDLLEIYPEGSLNRDEKVEIRNDFVLRSIEEVEERVEEVAELFPRVFEGELYAAINAKSSIEAKMKAIKEYDKDDEGEDEDEDENEEIDIDEKVELYEAIWKDREKYKHTHLRIGYIAHSIWQIRIAVCFGVIGEDEAWEYMEKLADFARPLMTLFDSWEAYNLNLQHFHEIYEFDYPEERKHIERARICLNLREESPLKLLPVDFGVDKDYIYNLKTHSNIFPKRIPYGQDSLRLMLAGLLDREDKTELFNELDKLSGKERDDGFAFVVYRAGRDNITDIEALIELPKRYPNAYAYAIRAQYFYAFAWEARGTGVASTVGEENYELFYERLGFALDDLLKAYELAPTERGIWANLYEVLSYFSDEESIQKREELYQLIRKQGLDHRMCVTYVSRHKETRWGGSFEENLDWAREVIAGTQKGERTRLIIYNIMLEHADYLKFLQEDETELKRFLADKGIQAEVNQYFDELIENIEADPYDIPDTLCHWYATVGDYERLRRVAHTMEVGKFDLNALYGYYDNDYTEATMNWFRSV